MNIFASNPQYQLAAKICAELHGRGYLAYFAGGCVRDYLLQTNPQDFDVATNAVPDVIEKLFPQTVAVGKKFGVIVVVEGEHQVEVATFRQDIGYQDGRRPESVDFSGAKEDALRRDFTVNALFYDLQKHQVIDFVQGQNDLKLGILRAVGDAPTRFQEDHLRLLRAVRFTSQLGFDLEASTWEACQGAAAKIRDVSGERTQEELFKLLRGKFLEKGLEKLFQSRIMSELLDQKPLRWRPPASHFHQIKRNVENQDDLWFHFFSWVSFCLCEREPLAFFESLCDKWKFSRELKVKTLKSMHWLYEDRPFLKKSMGELLALSYEDAHFRGLRAYGELIMKEDEQESYERFLQRRALWGSKKPEPWVVSQDLLAIVQGEQLGRALKLCYFQQLEGLIKSPADLLAWWKEQYVHGQH